VKYVDLSCIYWTLTSHGKTPQTSLSLPYSLELLTNASDFTMRHSFLSPLLLLGGLAVPAIAQAPPGLENIKDGEMSKRLIHYWADFKCLEFSDHSEAGPKEQCKKACLEFENTPSPGKFVGHSQTCVYDSTMESWFNSGKVLTPEERKQPLPRKCK
jgi:hypothetical protein